MPYRFRFKTGLFCLTCIFLGIAPGVWAQDCSSFLSEIREAWRVGDLDKVGKESRDDLINAGNQSRLRRCLNSLKGEEQLEAYTYLIIFHLYRDENRQAEILMEEFMAKRLKSNPDYSPLDNPPENGVKEFQQLYASLRSWPVYYYGFKVGGNYSGPRVSEEYRVDNATNNDSRNYTAEPGFQFGASVEIPIINPARKASLVGEILYTRRTYRFNDNILDFAKLEYEESQDWIDLPILFRYHFRRLSKAEANGKVRVFKNKFQPFIQGGVSFHYLLNAEANLSRTDDLGSLGGSTDGGTTRDPINGTFKLTQSDQRKPFNVAAVLGGGIRLKNFLESGGDFLVEARFQYGILDVVNGDERFANSPNQQRMLYNFAYIDSNFRFTSISFSLTYLFPVYKPKPLDNPNKGVLIKF